MLMRYQVQATVKAIITPRPKASREVTVLLEPNERVPSRTMMGQGWNVVHENGEGKRW